MTFNPTGPFLSVTGVSAAWGKRARKWLADRSLASWHDPRARELCAFEFKHGTDWTYDMLHKALEATR